MNNNLDKILSDRGIKKTWLARKLGINRNTLSAMIAGSTPPLDRAYKTARARRGWLAPEGVIFLG
jgi:DNA-binding XRE family transcriptional regulator